MKFQFKARNRRLLAGTLITALYSVYVGQAQAAPPQNYLNLSEKLVELRGQVSDLNNELQQLRDEHKLAMRGLMTQKNTIESGIRQDELALKTLRQDLLNNKKLIKEIGADRDSIKQALLLQSDRLKAYIRSGLPFKVSERIADIESFESRLEAGVISSHKAVNTLWSMIEDELKLAHENAVYRQPIEIDGRQYLAHVARLGSMLMYFRLNDERYGMYRKTESGWSAQLAQNDTQAAQIRTLFDSLEKQLRSGYFELPDTLARASAE